MKNGTKQIDCIPSNDEWNLKEDENTILNPCTICLSLEICLCSLSELLFILRRLLSVCHNASSKAETRLAERCLLHASFNKIYISDNSTIRKISISKTFKPFSQFWRLNCDRLDKSWKFSIAKRKLIAMKRIGYFIFLDMLGRRRTSNTCMTIYCMMQSMTN